MSTKLGCKVSHDRPLAIEEHHAVTVARRRAENDGLYVLEVHEDRRLAHRDGLDVRVGAVNVSQVAEMNPRAASSSASCII